MTSPANEMHVFLWQIGTVIPTHALNRDDGAYLPEEYIQYESYDGAYLPEEYMHLIGR